MQHGCPRQVLVHVYSLSQALRICRRLRNDEVDTRCSEEAHPKMWRIKWNGTTCLNILCDTGESPVHSRCPLLLLKYIWVFFLHMSIWRWLSILRIFVCLVISIYAYFLALCSRVVPQMLKTPGKKNKQQCTTSQKKTNHPAKKSPPKPQPNTPTPFK